MEREIKNISDKVFTLPGVEAKPHVPDIANHVPLLNIRWDQNTVKMTTDELRQALREGHPSIETVGGEESVDITTWMMNPGEERIVASTIYQILRKRS